MKALFLGENNRLRAGWRISIFVVCLMASANAIVFGLKAAALLPDGTLRIFTIVTIAAIVASFFVPLARRKLDRKTLTSLGLRLDRNAIKDLFFGFLLSGLMAAAIFALMLVTGLIEFSGINWRQEISGDHSEASFSQYLAITSIGSLLFLLLMDVIIGWWEELVFRGYVLQNMIEGLGLVVSIIISCIFYGLIHALNPNAGLLSTVIIMVFGYLRIYGYLATGQLWLSIGMHIGWNYFQGPVFGYAASGHRTATLIAQTPGGADWLSGGKFGPEGSVLILPVIGLALLAMKWWAQKGTVRQNEPIPVA